MQHDAPTLPKPFEESAPIVGRLADRSACPTNNTVWESVCRRQQSFCPQKGADLVRGRNAGQRTRGSGNFNG